MQIIQNLIADPKLHWRVGESLGSLCASFEALYDFANYSIDDRLQKTYANGFTDGVKRSRTKAIDDVTIALNQLHEEEHKEGLKVNDVGDVVYGIQLAIDLVKSM